MYQSKFNRLIDYFNLNVLQSFETEEEALFIANDSEFGLAAAVFSGDKARCARISRGLRAGIVWENCSQPTFIQAPVSIMNLDRLTTFNNCVLVGWI